MYVELYNDVSGSGLNDADYFGVYSLMEKIETDPNRVEIDRLMPWDNEGDELTGGYIFTKPNDDKFAVNFDLQNLWELFQSWILRHNHRQGESSEWADILNRFRKGIVNDADLKAIQRRETDDTHIDLDSMHLFYANLELQDLNKKMLSICSTLTQWMVSLMEEQLAK